ncbi:MAG: hypothetical protein WD894_24880 [Pirellulales bacterium]
MRSVLRCPYCRKRVVIGREGIHRAPKPVGGVRTAVVEKKIAPAQRAKPRGKTACSYVIVGGLFLAAVLAALPPLLIFRDPQASPAVETEALVGAAESFQSAWLAGDLELAETFVIESHRGRLKHWAAPRRAALVASFGERFEAKVTSVEVLQRQSDKAVIRVRFSVRGREQQTFQNWNLVGSNWAVSLE